MDTSDDKLGTSKRASVWCLLCAVTLVVGCGGGGGDSGSGDDGSSGSDAGKVDPRSDTGDDSMESDTRQGNGSTLDAATDDATDDGTDAATDDVGGDAGDGGLSKPASQGFDWVETHAGFDIIEGLARTDSGSFYAVGGIEAEIDGKEPEDFDAFLAKFDENGQRQQVELLGASDNESFEDVAVDSNGGVYAVGSSPNELEGKSPEGKDDALVVKYDESNNLQWLKFIGNEEVNVASGVTVGESGDVFVAGFSSGEVRGETPAGGSDGFVARLKPDSGNVEWFRYFGTETDDMKEELDSATDVAVSGSRVYAAGEYTRYESQMTVAAFSTSGDEQWVELDDTGDNTTGNDRNAATGVAVGSSGAVYISGREGNEAILWKYSKSGSKQWHTSPGQPSQGTQGGVSARPAGGAIIVGKTFEAFEGTSHYGEDDGFAAAFDASGNSVWIKTFGGEENEDPHASVYHDGSLYVAGDTESELGTGSGEFGGNFIGRPR